MYDHALSHLHIGNSQGQCVHPLFSDNHQRPQVIVPDEEKPENSQGT
jgi:hypothetical protein